MAWAPTHTNFSVGHDVGSPYPTHNNFFIQRYSVKLHDFPYDPRVEGAKEEAKRDAETQCAEMNKA